MTTAFILIAIQGLMTTVIGVGLLGTHRDLRRTWKLLDMLDTMTARDRQLLQDQIDALVCRRKSVLQTVMEQAAKEAARPTPPTKH